MAKFFPDKVRMTTATTGTGTITLSSAYDGSFSSLAEAMTALGAVNGDTTDYIVEEGADIQIVRDGVVGGGGTTITRGTTEFSKIGGVAGTSNLSLTGSAQVRFFPSGYSLTALLALSSGAVPKSGGTMTGLLTLSADPSSALHAVTKQYADNLIASADALVWKGTIDCSTNPNYPAANAGWTYRVSAAGKIGGASGVNVEAGDLLVCNVDSTSTGNQATVGSSWSVVQTNIDGFATAVADQSHAATSKTTPVDADELPLADSAASFGLKKLTWANLKAAVAIAIAAASDIWTSTDDVKRVTAKGLKDAQAWVAVTYASTVTLDFNTGINFAIGSLTGNITLANPSNLKAGWSGSVRLAQDGTGSRTISYGTAWKALGGTALALSTAASTVDYLDYQVASDGASVLYSLRKNAGA